MGTCHIHTCVRWVISAGQKHVKTLCRICGKIKTYLRIGHTPLWYAARYPGVYSIPVHLTGLYLILPLLFHHFTILWIYQVFFPSMVSTPQLLWAADSIFSDSLYMFRCTPGDVSVFSPRFHPLNVFAIILCSWGLIGGLYQHLLRALIFIHYKSFLCFMFIQNNTFITAF